MQAALISTKVNFILGEDLVRFHHWNIFDSSPTLILVVCQFMPVIVDEQSSHLMLLFFICRNRIDHGLIELRKKIPQGNTNLHLGLNMVCCFEFAILYIYIYSSEISQ